MTQIAPTVTRQVQTYVDRLQDNLQEGRGLWFCGSVGTGKRTLAMLVSEAALDRGYLAANYSLPRLLYELRSTFEESSQHSYLEMLDRLSSVDLLQIAHVGAEASRSEESGVLEQTSSGGARYEGLRPWAMEQLFVVVNARYEEKRAVVITSNLAPDELAEQIGERTVSRLEEMCEVLPLYGEDARRYEPGREAREAG